MAKSDHLSAFVKYHREKLGFTQEELAAKAGVGIRFIRELEQGKQSLRLDTINKVLSLLGHELRAERATIDAYNIWRDYFNVPIVFTLKSKQKVYGIIIEEIKNEDQKITEWKVVPNNRAIEWKETRDEKKRERLELRIKHSDVEEIDYQTR